MTYSNKRAALFAGAAVLLSPAIAHAAPQTTPEQDRAAEHRDDVVVEGERPTTETVSATKTDTPLVEVPQSVTVVDAGTIADLGLQNLNQALRYVAGVTPDTRGSAAEVYDQFKLRGFDAPVYLDGLRLFDSASGYAAPQVDVSRIERIEVLKGPASALYGQTTPGGLVDEASKLPLDRSLYGAVDGTYGTYDLYRVDADIGGRIAPGALWRLYGSANGASQQQSIGKRERETVSGAVTAGAGGPTSLTVLAAYSHDPFNGNYGVWPAKGTLVDNPAGRISTRFYGGEPNDFFKREQFGLTYIFRHDFGGGWALRSAGRYQYVKSRLGLVYTSGAPLDPAAAAPGVPATVFARASYATNEHLNDWTYDTNLTGTVTTGPLHHELLFGIGRQVAHSDELYAFGTATPIDVFDPVYGTMSTPSNPYEVPGYTPGFATPAFVDTHQRQQGLYAQDQIGLGGLRVTLSGRQDWARQVSGTQVQHDDKFTGRVGALYLTKAGIAPYVSYSTSFQPQASVLADGTIAKPSIGKQIEGGVKYQVPGTDFLLTGAYFHIEQTNVVVFDPLTYAANQVGKVRSQGVELEASGSLPYGFKVRAAFSRQKVRDLEDVNPLAIGRPLATVGKGGTTVNLAWAPRSGPVEGLEIGGTVRHVDSVYADLYSNGITTVPLRSPAYTVYDALIRYDLARLSPRLAGMTVGVIGTNIFDKRYLTSCFANYDWCWYGNRRTVQGTIGWRF